MTVRILQGDCRELLKTLQDASADAVVTDPPYHLTNKGGGPHGGETPYSRSRAGAASTGFMGMSWDGGNVAFDPATWRECLRVLKPGGHLLAFGGSRKYHRLACAVEDAGFEIRDQIMWLYGSGFPKSHNLHGDWEGWGTGLKPAHEPIVVARKPLIGTVAANVQAHGTGALNIDACRIGETGARNNGRAAGTNGIYGEIGATTPVDYGKGRWPANVAHDGSDEVVALFPSEAGAACFFYCPKASRKDRNDGLEGMPERPSLKVDPTSAMARDGRRGSGTAQNHHPTVKPTDLMRWLVRLVTPPGGTVLDPFAGSGSTGRAADIEGFNAVLIELNPDYAAIAERRIRGDAPLLAEIA